MSDDVVQALDRLRESVDSLRITMEAIGKPGAHKYLDELRDLHDEGLIDEKTLAVKTKGFLEKF